jgi:hypothetical protein
MAAPCFTEKRIGVTRDLLFAGGLLQNKPKT